MASLCGAALVSEHKAGQATPSESSHRLREAIASMRNDYSVPSGGASTKRSRFRALDGASNGGDVQRACWAKIALDRRSPSTRAGIARRRSSELELELEAGGWSRDHESGRWPGTAAQLRGGLLYMQVTGPKWAALLQIAHLTSSNNRPGEDVYLALHGPGPWTGCHWPRPPRALRWFDDGAGVRVASSSCCHTPNRFPSTMQMQTQVQANAVEKTSGLFANC
ncbi:hypothetical protein BBK36DRAFT_1139703 [Trichoderma citrinoviride]|uniref:Uncharacterized protein n=1 Tax=Trichoderma citrinoviride TaxID=58853 RepID=A0A2T4BFW8_9HYPO|nr:hypothetical protein BBK36DRAFT_1139703 [Trichoderma citrinoviride]PTB68202.1 hypothetical protein BBK36DRAFT_1139703 [Trichoderma citrinoviride]